ncbi:transcriptional regulator, Crp/Fnr family [Faunimonas pinastri]|uniref:Transcriptional regulator, Crp/Fnr family n=1 Tax=Faunimonas pinastri TaxID=1855383 RepID=A0A1H8Z8N1_9HYPH|nr:helix-turn-helix domain-containing protein [Faunimonas pinastri]SEP60693.1 transcriptional regulator, Crp/Fnr family [Faunimonas pinastri]
MTDPDMRADEVTAAERTQLARISQRLTFGRKETIYLEGADSQHGYVLIEGVVESYCMLLHGERRITAFLFPGDIFGMSEAGCFTTSARTVTPAVVDRVRLTDLWQLLEEDAALRFHLFCHACHQARSAQRHLLTLGEKTARRRVAGFLLTLQGTATCRIDDTRIALPMPQTDIADYLGVTPEAVSRSLVAMQREGLIRRTDRHAMEVADPAALRVEAGLE